MSDIKKGDVVKLKSGGPDMTVTDAQFDGDYGGVRIMCIWFDKADVKYGTFVPETLEIQ